MNQNTSATRALQEYVKVEKPGYAFMIEAPWGAGKTHLIRQEFQNELSTDKARYVSLNGVSNRRSFRRALLANTSEATLLDAAGKFGNAVGKVAKVGNVGSLLQDAIEDRMISNLPNLLIFDDVERCEMQPSELLGLINEFVEHQTKNVVLCAFIERDGENAEGEKRDDFLSRKEKVVGRTVRIVADARNALPVFISAMPDGHGKQWFEQSNGLVLEVFFAATHSNLRVLRQCLHDCGRVIDVLEEELRASRDAMSRFVRTYLVLSMTLATGEIQPKHLLDRENHRSIMKPDEGKKPHPLFTCFKQHPQAEIFAGNSASIIPADLGYSLIGIGYEEREKINKVLRATTQFSGEQEVPLWRRFVEWRLMPSTELESTYREACSYVFEANEIKPGAYLHVAHDLVSIAEDGFGNEDEIVEKILNRIQTLAKSNLIPAAIYGKGYGWSTDMGRFSFGGFAFDPSGKVKPLIKSMQKAQIREFEKSLATEAAKLLDLLLNDLDAFGREFSGNNGYAGYGKTPILHYMDAEKFAKAIFGYVTLGDFEAIGTQLQALGDRHRPESIPQELAWAREVRTVLIDLAEKAGQLEKARMIWFLSFNWKFPVEE